MIHEQQFAAYVGLDWGDQRHSVHLQVSGQPKAESFELEQKPEALHEWVARLVERFQERSHRFGTAAGFLDQAFRKTPALDSRFRADARATGPV